MKHSKACYLTASILSVVLLFLLTPIRLFRSVPMLVPGTLPEFPDSSGSGKGRSCPGGSGNGIFLLQSSFHSRCFLRGSFPHRFFRQPYRPAAISRKSSVLFSFLGVPFSHLMICFEAPLAAPRGLFSGGISPRARRAVVRHDR